MLARNVCHSARRLLACSPPALYRLHALTNYRTLSIQRRSMHISPPTLNSSELSAERYHSLSDSAMDNLLDSLESLLDGLGNPEYEVEYHSGVLTLKLGDSGTYVINKQPPNKQIWLSSPLSGPKRYDFIEGTNSWVYSRDGRPLDDLLSEELSECLDQKVEIALNQ